MTKSVPAEPAVETARLLNRGDISAAPLRRLPVISIFDDEHYENYDVDVIGPFSRRRIVKVLERAGYRLARGTILEAPDGPQVVFPKLGILGSDPVRPVEDLLAQGGSIVLVTPTQALLLYFQRYSEEGADSLAPELGDLVFEQPANLDKICDRLRRQELPARVFQQLGGQLAARQAEGTALRRDRRFRSRLPR
ncbi:MAG: hypothetical protein AAF581_01875 [Planctomycetota bacterium]